jgi:hypothetical protein
LLAKAAVAELGIEQRSDARDCLGVVTDEEDAQR